MESICCYARHTSLLCWPCVCRVKLMSMMQPAEHRKGARRGAAATKVQPDKDIFIRFSERIRKLNAPLPRIFRR